MSLIKSIILTSLATFTINLSAARPKGTVVTIHGFLRSRACTWALAGSFRRHGWRSVNWKYASRDRSIKDHARALNLDLQKIADAHPGEPIHFVTHSLGGLIVRAAFNDAYIPYEAYLGSVVQIAPPNRGSHAARSWGSNALGRFVFGDHAGRELVETPIDGFDESLGKLPQCVPTMVIAGDWGFNPFLPGEDDGKVSVWETRLTTPHQHMQLAGGHSWLTYSPKVLRLSRQFIGGEIEFAAEPQLTIAQHH